MGAAVAGTNDLRRKLRHCARGVYAHIAYQAEGVGGSLPRFGPEFSRVRPVKVPDIFYDRRRCRWPAKFQRSPPRQRQSRWRAPFRSDKTNTTNNLYLDTECGINRVAIRSTLTPGAITVTATRTGWQSASVNIDSAPVVTEDGLAKWMPPQLPEAAKKAREIERKRNP